MLYKDGDADTRDNKHGDNDGDDDARDNMHGENDAQMEKGGDDDAREANAKSQKDSRVGMVWGHKLE